MDSTAARKTQKADREKLRRDRLNEQFVELGNVLGKYKISLTLKIIKLSRGFVRLHMLIICIKEIAACCFFRLWFSFDAKNW